ncbi:hypothetical protein GCM10011611_06100 [Aliidongia dinghuensis]|uniref:DUF6969 domain-containing protein n=1 Tax=Aliidongia dinghuensis TaxID=1867774 RepID=A0A8J2YPM9_9PROT|nr:hypothetical protein [Aliidongia dinghuensis]GGF03408.1 hypothetical protein GCM10011611_06100 [Aliidongia dinghuensis]
MIAPNAAPIAAAPVSVGSLGAAEAAAEYLAVMGALADARIGPLEILAGGVPPEPGPHYPAGEVWDQVTHAQYFFHAHADGDRHPGEVGHFHTFLGQGGMPRGLVPLVLPEMALAPLKLPVKEKGGVSMTHRSARDRGVFSHLIGISVDAAGVPLALFTTNRWVTGETWYRAEDVIRLLDRFAFAEAGPTALVDRWLVAVLRLLRRPVVELIEARDAVMMDWRRRRSRQSHVFDDRRLEVMSERPIDFAAALAEARAQVA